MSPRDLVFMILINIVWGLNFIALKYSLADFDPIFANALRFALVVIALLPFLKVVRGQMKLLLLTCFVLGVLHFGFMMIALEVADDVAPIAIAAQLAVPFSTLLAVLVLKEPVGWKRTIAIATSFAGVMVMGFDPMVFDYVDGLILMAISAFLYGVSTILLRRLQAVPAMTTQAWVALAGMVGSLLLSMGMETGQIESLALAGTPAWLAIAYSGLLSSVVGHGGINYLLRKYEVAVISPYTLMTPLVAVIGSVLILGEVLTTRMVLGGLMTLAGVLIITVRNSNRKPVNAET